MLEAEGPLPSAADGRAQAVRREIEGRLAGRRARVARHSAVDRAFSWVRGAIAVAALLLFWFSLGPRGLSPLWLLVPVAAFLVAVVLHDGVVRRRRLAERASRFYERSLARIDELWAGEGDAGERFLDEVHPYAADLDIFGRGSLYQLLCTARTRAGQQTLAGWLCAPATMAVASERQAAVAELREALDLREDLALAGEDVRGGVAVDALRRWAEAPPLSFPRHARKLSALLATLDVLAATTWILGAGPDAFLLALALAGAWAVFVHSRVERTVRSADRPGQDLALLAALLDRLERKRFSSPRLAALGASLDTDGQPPSVQVRRLARLQVLIDSRRNQLFFPISLPLLWTTQLALAVEDWRRRVGPRIPVWLDVVGEVEALCSLAAFAFEHPDDPFPELVAEGPRFEATGLGHPLLPSGAMVRNDVRLDGEQALLLVSGSNMSGKSTLLRAVATNAVLALCGAPVRAMRLRLSPLSLGASIRVVDSLQQGASRFYAEIKRLRLLVDLAREHPPLLFLLDEILHGTNSGDRRVGAEAVVRGLLSLGGFGLVTTHDLALARIADELAPRARNVHFEDHLEGGRIAFDYRLRDGVVTRSNAVALMRAVGLEV